MEAQSPTIDSELDIRPGDIWELSGQTYQYRVMVIGPQKGINELIKCLQLYYHGLAGESHDLRIADFSFENIDRKAKLISRV